MGDIHTLFESAARAAELSENLPARVRRLLEGFAAFVEGRAEEVERLYRILVTNHPHDWDAWKGLGETLFHFNGARGIEDRGLAPGFEARYRSYALYEGPDNELEAQFRVEDPHILMLTTLSLLAGQHLQGAEGLARMQTGRDRPEEVRASGHAWIADMHAARGRLKAAREELELVSTLDGAAYLTGRARLVSLPFLPRTSAPPVDHALLMEQIEAWDAGAVQEREYYSYLLPVADARHSVTWGKLL